MPELLRPLRRRDWPRALREDTEAIEIELARTHTESVARRLRLEHFRPEGLPQLRDEVLQGRGRRPRWVLAPERIDEPVDRDDAARCEQEKREHGALFLAAEEQRARLI